MVEKIKSDEVVETICRGTSEGIVIYGAGLYGRTLYQYLEQKYHVDIKCFAVSSREHLDCERIESKAVVLIDEVAKENSQCILVIAVSEQKQRELLDLALKLGFTKIYLVLNEFLRYMQSELNVIRLEPLKMLKFEVHITDHCNLNCKGCYHFSPLSEESFLSTEEFERDLKQLSEICKGEASHITLLGGEPLLHPQVTDFFYITRKYFEKCEIELLTNGVLLNRMDEKFWQACVENRVFVNCTKYPVKIDYDSLEKKAETYNLHIDYHNDVGAGEKMLIKYPFDLQGKQPIEWNYAHCTRSNKCITLKHGRLFTCPMAAHAHLAKDFFGLNMELSDKDSIDIYEVRNFEEIARFLITPIPFCRYCNLKVKPEQQEWSVSKKSMDEWF